MLTLRETGNSYVAIGKEWTYLTKPFDNAKTKIILINNTDDANSVCKNGYRIFIGLDS